MALAFGLAGMENEKNFYLSEMEKATISSTIYSNASGFPYASNLGTTYGAGVLWDGSNTDISISGGAWYLFAKQDFNPFAIGHDKNIPMSDIFW